jgi:hypothetical protein
MLSPEELCIIYFSLYGGLFLGFLFEVYELDDS